MATGARNLTKYLLSEVQLTNPGAAAHATLKSPRIEASSRQGRIVLGGGVLLFQNTRQAAIRQRLADPTSRATSLPRLGMAGIPEHYERVDRTIRMVSRD
jgi:hypothetical protein